MNLWKKLKDTIISIFIAIFIATPPIVWVSYRYITSYPVDNFYIDTSANQYHPCVFQEIVGALDLRLGCTDNPEKLYGYLEYHQRKFQKLQRKAE